MDDGEVILLKMPEIKQHIDYGAKNIYAIEPATDNASNNRVLAQDSIFIHAKNGFIIPNDTSDSNAKTHAIKIENNLKIELLEYLRKYHNIEPKTIFGDVIGVIDNEKRSNPFDYYKGMIAYKEGKFKKAFAIFDGIIKKNPRSFGAFNGRGVVLSAQKKTERAIDDYSKAIDINPDYDLPYFNRANAWLEIGDSDQALLDLHKSIKIDPENKFAYFKRGEIYTRQYKFKEVLKDLNCALKIDHNFADALRLRVKVNFDLNRNIHAQKDLESYLRTKPEPINAYALKGYCYFRCNNHKEGIKEYDKVISMDPGNIEAYFQIGKAKCETRDFEEAIWCLDIVIDLLNSGTEKKPDSIFIAIAHAQRGLAKLNCGKLIDGINDLSKALKDNFNNPEIYYNRSLAYFEIAEKEEVQGNMDKAMRNYKYALADIDKVIEFNTNFTEAHDKRKKINVAMKNLKKP